MEGIKYVNLIEISPVRSYRDMRYKNGDLAVPVNNSCACAARLSWLLTHDCVS